MHFKQVCDKRKKRTLFTWSNDTFPKSYNLMIITFVWSHSLVVSLHWWLPVMKVGVCYTTQYFDIFLLQLFYCINSSKQLRQMKIVDCVVGSVGSHIEKLHLGTALKYPRTHEQNEQIGQNIFQYTKWEKKPSFNKFVSKTLTVN